YHTLHSVLKSRIINLLPYTPLLSVNLAIINFLPIPPLHPPPILFLLYHPIFTKPLNKKPQTPIIPLPALFVLI
ncbi:site-2 protease family protein, partial [Staphylococcus epidermidis]|uniref:site-2 protease family protein n=1 Tax=Staphylococcus epidermidis TaxID=1282 RepID=UPI001642B7D2